MLLAVIFFQNLANLFIYKYFIQYPLIMNANQIEEYDNLLPVIRQRPNKTK